MKRASTVMQNGLSLFEHAPCKKMRLSLPARRRLPTCPVNRSAAGIYLLKVQDIAGAAALNVAAP
jgi:hypothetical protein